MRWTLLAPMLLVGIAHAEDWRQWRGPSGQHHAAEGATAPTEWGERQGLAWNTPIPGRGHSSPTIVGERIYLTTADEQGQTQSLLVLDRRTGALARETVVHRGKLPAEIHPNNTHASPTVASDGQHVFALFHNDLACWVTKFDLAGEIVWQKRVAAFDPQQYKFGFGSSPVIVGDVLIIATVYDGSDSGLYAIRCDDGEPAWSTARPQKLSYSTPARFPSAGKTLLLLSGNYLLASYDAASGRELWSTEGGTWATCGTMVWDPAGDLAFASGGYPDSFTLAVKTDGEHEVVWQKNIKCYEQSLLWVDGYVYAVADSGVAHCLRATDGETMWRQRLGGSYSASPLLVDGKVYVTNEQGTTFIFKASGEDYQPVGENQLGDECFATSTPLDGRLYHRYAKREGGRRQEYLAAIGE